MMQSSTHREPRRYAVVADRLWDGVSNEAHPAMALIVCEDAIEAIVPCDAVAGDLPRVELAGCTLLPGLIDAHVHYSAVMGPAFLAAGVTTIRDVGNDLAWILKQRELHAQDPSLGPTIVCCGHLHDGPVAYWSHMGRAHADAEALRASIRHHAKQGVDAIKLYAGLDLPMLRAGVDEAHRQGKFVLAHLGPRAEDAVRAGLDEIEHLAGCDVAWREATQAEDDALIDLFLEHDVVLDPTFVVWDRLARILERSFHHDARRCWAHPCHRAIWDGYLSRFDGPEGRLKSQAALPHLKRFLRRAHQRGVTVAVGTDTPFPHLVPGFSVHDELAMFVDAGIAPVDALRSATSVNARVLGVDQHVGKLEAGIRADFVAIQGNPLDNIDRISDVAGVFRNGRMFESSELLAKAQATYEQQPDDAITHDLLDYVNGRRGKA